ncbi:hypothetical protein UFOVP787_97 [uncultured Caudovirales phage]|uniref:Uncharacterized protein n=1 Tax=uncultured Caudovirales phage TaxID=2100421 RepID=A0A6J5NUQ9_9CAUD|nr:hypothetical protein UFOVP787_97 [uncultured Caudovirales phage]
MQETNKILPTTNYSVDMFLKSAFDYELKNRLAINDNISEDIRKYLETRVKEIEQTYKSK